jgi:serine protease Do
MRRAIRVSVSLVAIVGGMGATVATQEQAVPMNTHLFREIARQQNPMVVAIMTKARVGQTAPHVKEWFEWFFGEPLPPEDRVQRGVGSGFLISRDGEILTNDHVVAGADVIEVGLLGDDTRTYHARLVGRDPLSDSALIRLVDPPTGLAVATLGNSDALEPGDWVMAIGNPFQLGHTVTVGIVSYQGRPFEVAEGTLQKMIQTDASINPGNSGGPLLNVRGEVVGINAAIVGQTGGSIGIGFAIPINGIKTLLPQLRAGKVIRGRIGVALHGSLNEAEATALGFSNTAGALITFVERNSPADRGGLRAGDLVIAFDESPVIAAEDLLTRVSSAPPGSEVAVTVTRAGHTYTLEVSVEALPTEDAAVTLRSGEGLTDLGLTFVDMTPAIAEQLLVPSGIEGAIVRSVRGGSSAARAGLQEGDVVSRVNRHVIHDAAEADRELHAIQAPTPVFLLVWRHGNEVLVHLRHD